MIVFLMEDALAFTRYKTKKSLFEGLAELCHTGIIARRPADNLWFINPLFAFFGNRVLFAEEYIKNTVKKFRIPLCRPWRNSGVTSGEGNGGDPHEVGASSFPLSSSMIRHGGRPGRLGSGLRGQRLRHPSVRAGKAGTRGATPGAPLRSSVNALITICYKRRPPN